MTETETAPEPVMIVWLPTAFQEQPEDRCWWGNNNRGPTCPETPAYAVAFTGAVEGTEVHSAVCAVHAQQVRSWDHLLRMWSLR